MIRTLLWLVAGLLLGGIIHIAVILGLPSVATRDIWTRVAAFNAVDRVVVLPSPGPGDPNPMGLDPELVYGLCQLSLASDPGLVNGRLPVAFWSVAVFNRQGHVLYSTTDRSGSGDILDMGIFNAAQTRLLAEQRIEIEEGLLIVEADADDIFVVIRLAPPHGAMRARYEAMIEEMRCLNVR